MIAILGASNPSIFSHPTFIAKLDTDLSGICSSAQVLLAWTACPDIEILMEEKIPFVLDPNEETLRCLDQLLAEVWDGLGMVSHKMSLIAIFGQNHFRQKFHQKFYVFMKKFQQPLILVLIWYESANFDAKLH